VQITEYLDHDLGPHRRVQEMQILADRIAQQPTAEVLDDLATVLETRTLTGEDLLRLNILLSQLYRAKPDVDGDLDAELRDLVSTVWEQSRTRQHPLPAEGGDRHVVLEPGLPQDGLLHRAPPGPGPLP
jgi:hypothetical protein